jgi:cobalt-zinc-cadmium efflux system outer membrane protein
VLTLFGSWAVAQGPDRGPSAAGGLAESEAIARALARAPFMEVLTQRVVVAESFVAEAATFPNPLFDVERDQVGLPAGTSTETKYRLGQTFDISGRRGLRREAAERRVEAAQSDGSLSRLELATQVRQVFAEALLRAALRDTLIEWGRRLDRTAATLEQLRRMGDVSGYDRRRLEQERLGAKARLAVADADYARAWERLLGLIGGAPGAMTGRPVGALLPSAPPPLRDLEPAIARRADVRSLDARALAQDREREVARRGWIPDLTLTIGAKDVSGPEGSGTGLILGAAIPIPVFDRRDPAAQRADAEARALRAERDLVVAKALGDLRGLWRQTTALGEAAARFKAEAADGAGELARIAETAYRGGETGILQLLDAYRTVLEADTTALEFEYRARQARIELDLALGVIPGE